MYPLLPVHTRYYPYTGIYIATVIIERVIATRDRANPGQIVRRPTDKLKEICRRGKIIVCYQEEVIQCSRRSTFDLGDVAWIYFKIA